MLRSALRNGRQVIAEYTMLKILDWAIPTERRFATLSTRETKVAKHFFEDVDGIPLEIYPGLDGSASLLIRNNAYMYDTAGANWIALNPSIARRLGWCPRRGQPLAWVDAAGVLMVETIWWIDGAMQHHPPSMEDEVAEGWLVLASSAAYEAIALEYPALTRVMRTERSFTLEGGAVERRVRDWTETVS